MMHLDTARYSLSVAQAIWNVPGPTARLYANEYLKFGDADKKAAGQGSKARLTARRILQGAIGAELAPHFRSAAIACEAALSFTDMASPDEAPGFERDPGELFAHPAMTALIAYSSGRGVVVRVDGKTPMRQLFFPIGGASVELGRQEKGAFLLLDFVVKRVEQKLQIYNSGGVIG